MSRPHSPTMTLDPESIQRLTRRVDQVCEVMARVSGSALPAAEFFQTLTTKTLSIVDGPAGSVWLRSPQGLLQQAHQTNVSDVGLDDFARGRELHGELLKHAMASKQLCFLEPGARIKTAQNTDAANPSAYPLAIAPILDDQGGMFGLFEVWLDADGPANMRALHVNFVNHMAGYATMYLRNTTALRNSTQEQIFTQVESFSRQVHASLNPTEVAFLIVNEGRRLISCDRLSAGVRHGHYTRIEAVSGSDLVEHSSVQVKAM